MSSLDSSRAEITAYLYTDPHNPYMYAARGAVHEKLGFPDLAAADAYRALSLLESVVDPDGCDLRARRKKEQATGPGFDFTTAKAAAIIFAASRMGDSNPASEGESEDGDGEGGDYLPITESDYNELIGPVYELLVRSLIYCGCLKDAFDFCSRGLELFHEVGKDDSSLRQSMDAIKSDYKKRYPGEGSGSSSDAGGAEDDGSIDPGLLAAMGSARRVQYPWNRHEPNRTASETIRLLNKMVEGVAPKCEVRAIALPSLHDQFEGGDKGKASVQLGLFAKEDILPGEVFLRESSVLTATGTLHSDLCDACNTPLPRLSSENPPVACKDCEDTIFCSRTCHDQAQNTYHSAICGRDSLSTIGRDVQNPKDKADYLYLLLVNRAMAMAATQKVHPLDLPEVKYIWGDFQDLTDHSENTSLPFSFQLNILQPARLLEEMGLDPFISLPLFDTWVVNTLYAKFRATASGRLSTWDGGPELCAVHPLWCLANHSCDPNVCWEWGSEISFCVRSEEERPVWRRGVEERKGEGAAGIRKGEEILNHYCDIRLGVKERREWAAGALGGLCQCERCVWEDAAAA